MSMMRRSAGRTGADQPKTADSLNAASKPVGAIPSAVPASPAQPTAIDSTSIDSTSMDSTSMDVVAYFLLDQARQPALGDADQKRLEDLLFAYLHAGFGSGGAFDVEWPRGA
jgi:hypothetical protein